MMNHPAHRILFVDDEQHILNALKRCLHKEPYQCVFTDSGAGAMAMLAQQPFSIVVSDMRMPKMTGVELLKQVASQYPQTMRLVLSAWADSSEILDAVNEGHIYRYIIKPWDDRALRLVLRQAVEVKELQIMNQELMERLQRYGRELEQRVEQRTAELLKIQNIAEIGKYASQIVHNLNNPLHAIGGVIDLLGRNIKKQRSMQPEEMTQYLDIAKRGVKDLKSIISGILLHVRDQTRFEVGRVDINALIEQELKFFQLDDGFKDHIEPVLSLDADLPGISGQPVQIKQILDNLIKNAWDAMVNAEAKRLMISTKSDESQVVIEVRDTGEGIASENLDRIFNPEYTTKPVGQGTGLGLAGVKTMVESYAGTIEVESCPGRGTAFTVKLPVSDAIS
ncbi:MAG: ATP-binding protein [Desulfobacteraceae bacterium]|jgi:signal transduction histidine kinase